jgi:hypothetical protein
VQKKKDIDIGFLDRAIEVLGTVLDEFDTSDADYDEGLLKTAFTALINDGFMTKPSKTWDLSLRDLVAGVLGDEAPEDLLDRAETFDNLVDTYVGEPSDEDMAEAYSHLDRVVKSLKKKVEGLTKRKERQRTLWKND